MEGLPGTREYPGHIENRNGFGEVWADKRTLQPIERFSVPLLELLLLYP